jgi:hypothetical protein
MLVTSGNLYDGDLRKEAAFRIGTSVAFASAGLHREIAASAADPFGGQQALSAGRNGTARHRRPLDP